MRRRISSIATRKWLMLLALLSLGALLPLQVVAQNPGPVALSLAELQAAADVDAYWTEERMANAIPKDLIVAMPQGAELSSTENDRVRNLQPGFAAGAPPSPEFQLGAQQQADGVPQTSPPFGPPANPTDFVNYAPFQRWTHFGAYTTYPISTVGKLFFTQNGLNFVCSASVIARNTIATAGHCVHDGNGSGAGWSTNVRFCPGYSASGAVRGCWNAGFLVTSSTWFNTGGVDRDYACAVTAPTGSLINAPLGNVTGATGRAWNWPTRQLEMAYGYPQASPFPGFHIITTASTEWYEVNMTAGDGLVSKYIGSDQTGGSSGGPWWLSLRHPNTNFDYPDTDGSSFTDPPSFGIGTRSGGPYINGVNSHKRCTQGGCPPGSIFTQEMGSPQFTSDPNDAQDSEDVFAVCFQNGGV